MKPAKIVIFLVPAVFGLMLLIVSAEARQGRQGDNQRSQVSQRQDQDRIQARRMMGMPGQQGQRDWNRGRQPVRQDWRNNTYRSQRHPERISVGISSLENTAAVIRTPVATRTSYVPRIPFIPSLPGD